MSPSARTSCVDRETTYSVVVELSGDDRSILLALASALHRRGVDVVDARLAMSGEDHRRFEATIVATARQAGTVEATLMNLVHVTRARVIPCGFGQGVAV